MKIIPPLHSAACKENQENALPSRPLKSVSVEGIFCTPSPVRPLLTRNWKIEPSQWRPSFPVDTEPSLKKFCKKHLKERSFSRKPSEKLELAPAPPGKPKIGKPLLLKMSQNPSKTLKPVFSKYTKPLNNEKKVSFFSRENRQSKRIDLSPNSASPLRRRS